MSGSLSWRAANSDKSRTINPYVTAKMQNASVCGRFATYPNGFRHGKIC
ncbi:hypothetical protein Z946_449 [Sulfitobacter noctilucicola]|nr:hypothetical protein Z946_449 [Sulfitobacter noctilucicola]